MLTSDPADPPALLVHGEQSICRECGLVLEARGIAFDLLEDAGVWSLWVKASLLPLAQRELALYARERDVKPDQSPALIEHRGAPVGSLGFTIVLLSSAYCAGIGLFGVDWYAAGALERTVHGGLEAWRAVTALTLHIDALHLLSNLMFGVAVGAIVSTMFGPGIAWLSILVAGALGNGIELLIAPADHRAVGASTAVFAALGLLSGFGWRRQLSLREKWLHRWAPLIAGVCLLTLLGAGDSGQHVDVLGHLLGFSTGVAMGWLYARWGIPANRQPIIQKAAGLIAVLLLLVSWSLALTGSH